MADQIVDFADLKCLRCQQAMIYLGQLPIRSGGESGLANVLWGDWAQIEEKVVKLYTYRCSNCGHLEFFDLDMSLPEARPQEIEEEQEWEQE